MNADSREDSTRSGLVGGVDGRGERGGDLSVNILIFQHRQIFHIHSITQIDKNLKIKIHHLI